MCRPASLEARFDATRGSRPVVALTTAALYPVIVALNRDMLRLSVALLDSNVELLRTLGSAIACS